MEIIVAVIIGGLLFKLILDRREKNAALKQIMEERKNNKNEGN